MVFNEFISGGISGITSTFIGYPLDMIRLNLQVKNVNSITIIKETLSKNNYNGYFKGLSFPLISSFPLYSVAFGTYMSSFSYFKSNNYNIYFSATIASILSAIPTSIISTPVEIYKCLMQSEYATNKNYSISNILNQYTLKNYRASLFREIPFHLLFFGSHELLYNYYNYPQLASSIITGCVVWIIGMPFDTVRSNSFIKNWSIYNSIINIYRINGLKGFYRGLSTSIIRTIPVSCTCFYTYEIINNMLI